MKRVVLFAVFICGFLMLLGAQAQERGEQKPQSTEAQGSQQQPSPSLGSSELPKTVSNGTHELQVTKTTRGRKFQNMQTRNENDVFLTVYLATKDPCFDWQNNEQCFSTRVKGFDKVSKACGSVVDDSGKKYVADGGGNTMDGNTIRIMCNYIVPKTLGAVTLRLTGYPEIKLPAE